MFIKRFLNNNTFYYFIIILTFIIIIAFSCVINDIKKIAEDPDFKVKWDIDLRIPVFDKESSPISLKEYVEEKALNPSEVTVAGLAQWPIALDPGALDGTLTIDTNIDIDNDSIVDFILEGFYKARSDLLVIQVWLTNDTTSAILPISSDCINIQGITIEGRACNLGTPVSQNNILVYTSTNFLDPLNEYYLDLTDSGLAGELDILVDVELLNGSPPNYGAPDTYTIHVRLIFNLGDNFGIVGEITNAGILFSELGKDIPINDLPMEELNKFKMDFLFNSYLPFNLEATMNFYGSKKIPSPSTFPTSILSGILSTSTIHGYQYVSSYNKSTDEFKFNNNVLSYGDMKMDLILTLPAPTGPYPTGNKIRLDMNNNVKVKVIVSTDATISL